MPQELRFQYSCPQKHSILMTNYMLKLIGLYIIKYLLYFCISFLGYIFQYWVLFEVYHQNYSVHTSNFNEKSNFQHFYEH